MSLEKRKPAALGKGQAGSDIDFSANNIKIIRPGSKKISLRKHINQMCKSCIYDPRAFGTWREQVKRCTSYNCPLFNIRPVPKGANSTSKPIESGEIVGRAA